jgi:hypothetical protein
METPRIARGLLCFFAFWAAGVLTGGLVAYVIRLMIKI